MRLFLKYMLIVIAGLVVCDIIVSFVVEKIETDKSSPALYSVCHASSEIAIMGSSRASHHYIPKVLSDSLHLSAHNYGIGGQNIFIHYLMLEMLLEKASEKPGIVILELSTIDVYDTPQWNEETMNIAYPYYHKEKCVRELLTDVLDPKETFFVKYSGLYRHNSKYITYLGQMITGADNDSSDGYLPLLKQWNDTAKYGEEENTIIHPLKVKYIHKYVELCKKNSIKLIFAVSPYYKKLPAKQNWVAEIERIARNNDIPFLYHEKDTMFLEHREWFNDPYHLNDKGANIYTRMVCSEIKDATQM